jgi:tetratricopeptide (TPR) repeat protein
MANPEEGMLKEAMAAVESGDRARARDLFTRLLKINQDQVDYWLWMSALVETARERTYCLKEVLKRDPTNTAARRGMQIMGIAAPDENQVVPRKLQRRNWEAAVLGTDQPEKAMAARNLRLTLGVAGGLLLIVVLAVAGILAARKPRYNVVYVTPDLSYKESPTFLPTNSPVVRSPTPTFNGPTPLWMQMEATYTPTALYASTPHSAEAYRIAMRAYARGEWVNAEEYLFQVATIQPDQPDLLYFIGETNRFQEQYPSALGYYNQAISASPNFAPAYLGRARARLAEDSSSREEPLKDLDQAISLDPNLGEAYLEKAGVLIADRRFTEALGLLDSAAGLLPDSPLVAFQRSESFFQLERLEEALAEARRANQLDITLLPAYRLLGETLLANGQAAEALEALKTYTTYETKDAGAYVLLARAYEKSDDFDGALQTYGLALGLDARLIAAYAGRGELYYTRAVYDQAAADFEQADRLDKNQFAVVMDLGRSYYQLKNYGNAYMNFERGNGLAENDGQKAEVLFWRAQSLEKLDEIETALRDYKALLELPQGAADPGWVAFAATQAASLSTPTRTPVTPTLTSTLRPTGTPVTPTVTRTRQPTQTFTPTPTPKPKS